ncbi:protein takeout [Drosophila innubila]|uniref:protein takeout n=1 Tax=Drosophila innubila TaxID=198719 RepID=UPI00148D7D40|nr:protein takeout [Drosophila innubila]
MREILIVAVVFQCLIESKCQILPKNIKKCHYGDSKCIIRSMNDVIKHNPRGIPAIGMKPTDVVDIQDVELWNNDALGGVWFKFRLFNQVNYGFENTTITQIKGFGREPTSTTMEIHGQIPSLIHKGNYVTNGRVWLLELNSTGESYSDFQNFRFSLKLKVITEYRNNTRYLKIYELVPLVNMKRWILWLEDFFTENSDLTIYINRVFNENWLQFYNEMEPTILRAFKDVFTNMIEGIFDKIPYDELFLQSDTETEIEK